MNPILSVILPTIRKERLAKLYESFEKSYTGTWELIVVSPYELPEELKGKGNIKYIQDWGNPVRCQQIGLVNATGQYVTRAVDDSLYLPGAMDKAFLKASSDIIVALKYTESNATVDRTHAAFQNMNNPEFYNLTYHHQTLKPYVPAHFKMLNFGIFPREISHKQNAFTLTKKMLLSWYEKNKEMFKLSNFTESEKQKLLQSMSLSIYEKMAENTSFKRTAENKNAMQKLCTRLFKTGEIDEEALREVLGYEITDTPSRLQETTTDNVALSKMSFETSQGAILAVGGWDCQFESVAIAELDLAIRLQMFGAEVTLSNDIVLECDWMPGHEGDHGPMHDAFAPDMEKYSEIYSNPSCEDRVIIDIGNWKNSPEKWERRFGKQN